MLCFVCLSFVLSLVLVCCWSRVAKLTRIPWFCVTDICPPSLQVRKKHSSIKLQRLFRERWARLGLTGSGAKKDKPAPVLNAYSSREQKCAIKVQSVFRGHLARVSAAVIQQAREAGVMVAINGTVQGQSGYVCNIFHSLTCFVRQNANNSVIGVLFQVVPRFRSASVLLCCR